MRYKCPDKKSAISILEASQREMKYTESLEVSEDSGSTIVRNTYECFRMLGEALLIAEGIDTEDHVTKIRALMKLHVKTDRPVNIIDNLRILRHKMNYYGYRPGLPEINDTISMAKSLFEPLAYAVEKKINNPTTRPGFPWPSSSLYGEVCGMQLHMASLNPDRRHRIESCKVLGQADGSNDLRQLL